MIHVTEHAGKMAGIRSISTSVLLNANCKKNATVPGSICAHCYANTLCQMRRGLAEALAHNTEELCRHVIDVSTEVPDLSEEDLFRLESFGDLNNSTQLHNYINIVRAYPEVRFGLYTKMYYLVAKYFNYYRIPDNMNLVLSSLMVNQPIDWTKIIDPATVRPGQVKVFTVYDKKYIAEHPELVINCGSRNCNGCRLCYDPTTVIHVNEILKSDQAAAEDIINWRTPEFVDKMYEKANNIIKRRIF